MLIKKNIGNSIEFSNNNGYVVIKTTKEDLNDINNKYGLNNLPATYLVIGDSNESDKIINFYVGESSVNVINRLKESFSKRPWIKEIFIITSPQGNLTMEIVKSLEFMVFQTLNNCLTNLSEGTKVKTDNGITGVIGYRAQIGENNYSLLINDIFKLFFNDVFLYSKYKIYFNDFDIQTLISPTGKVCLDKKTNDIYSSFILDDSIKINKNSRLSIELDTIGNSNDGVKLLFKTLLSNKNIYPIITNDKVQWCFSNTTIIPRHNMDNFVILCSNSLNANISNSTLEYKNYLKRL